MCNSVASSSAANSPSRPVPARRANSPIAAITVHVSRASWRRAAEMIPISWSSEQPARPEPSSPVTVSTTAARRGPGVMVSAAAPCHLSYEYLFIEDWRRGYWAAELHDRDEAHRRGPAVPDNTLLRRQPTLGGAAARARLPTATGTSR